MLVGVFLVLLVAGTAVNLAILPRVYNIAPADGVVYLDAFDRALDGQVTVQGDRVSAEVLDQIVCTAHNPHPLVRLATNWTCGDEEPEPGRPQDWGATTAWIHPPTYFFAEAGMTRAVGTVLPDADPVAVARVLGSVWFAAGGTLLVLLGVLWGARPLSATLGVLAFLPTPVFVSTFAYLTPDRAVLLVGAGTLIAVTAWLRGRLPLVWLALVGLLVGGLFKQTFVLAALTGALLICVIWLLGMRGHGQRLATSSALLASGLLVGGAVVGAVAWQAIKSGLGQPLPPRPEPDALTLSAEPGNLFTMMFQGAVSIPGNDSQLPALEPLAMLGISAMMVVITAGAAMGTVLIQPPDQRLWAIAVTGVLAIGLGGVVVGILGSVSAGNWLPPAPRYVMPAFAAYVTPLLVLAGQRRWLAVLLAGVAVIGTWTWVGTQLM